MEGGIFVRVKFLKYIGPRDTGGKSFYPCLNCIRNLVIYKVGIILHCVIKYFFKQDPFGDILHWLLPIWAPNGKVSFG